MSDTANKRSRAPLKTHPIRERKESIDSLSQIELLNPRALEPLPGARSTSLERVYEKAGLLGALARQALIAEAELTPKPGLVDHRGSGAHTDLSLDLMKQSALVIEPFICEMACLAANKQPSASLRIQLAAIGRAAETAMFNVTNGSNTHKGAIWTLGLLAASVAINPSHWDASTIAKTASKIAAFEDSYVSTQISHGKSVAQKFGVTGARGEAMAGFPHIIDIGLPMLRSGRTRDVPETIAQLDTLLAIMAQLDDTCVLYRGGEIALQLTKNGAASVIRDGGVGSSLGMQHLRMLDLQLLALGISPGGSADLLAATLFLDAIECEGT
jgi:triphosphoribosyl-dephospho-CoA synthase